jgi:hypothetical protein
MDGEYLVEMVSVLSQATLKNNERERLLDLIEAVRRQAPAVFEERAAYLVSWQVETALALGREQDLPALTQQMAQQAGSDADMFDIVSKRLEYHGRLDLLLPMARTAWPLIRDSDDLVPLGG